MNPPAPFPLNLCTVPIGWGEVESGGTPGTVAAMSSFPSPSKSARARAVGMNASPLSLSGALAERRPNWPAVAR